MPDHPFAATLSRMRKPEKQGGGFANLAGQQQWEWHADVYAFRHVCLGHPIDDPSPCDPYREWWAAPLIDQSVAYYRAKHVEPKERRKAARDRELLAEGVDICNRWARQEGFADFADAQAAGRSYSDVVRSIAAAMIKRMPTERLGFDMTIEQVREALGVKAKETKEFKPSRQEMERSRRELRDLGEPGTWQEESA